MALINLVLKSVKSTGMLIALLSLSGTLQAQDEYVGPFNSWANVKKRFGAKGDGKTDDTKYIQQAIDQFANGERATGMDKNPFTVLYFPPGTYLISQTLMLKGKIGITIIGEDPRSTIIKWIGKNSDTMLLADGSAYFKISRLSWQGNKRSGIEAIGVHWLTKWNNGKTRSYATLNIELSDMEFSSVAVGIGGGTFLGAGTGSNDSEITIRRCSFNFCTDAGIRIGGFNALDYWIWYCRFNNCRYGVYNANGNYHINNSNFKNSTESDFYNKGGYYLSVRECFSDGSRAFSKDEGSSCNPFKRIFQKNTVINCSSLPVEYYHLGNVSLFDNVFTSTADRKDTSEINLGSWCPGFYSLLSLNNQYAYKEPISIAMPRKKLMRYGDAKAVRPKPRAKVMEPALPPWPVRQNRPVLEVPANASSHIIQSIINKAASLKNKKPVVHFALGKYYLDQSIEIAAGTDMQLCGDGIIYSTQLLPKDPVYSRDKPMIIIYGPSVIRITDMQLGVNVKNQNVAAGIELKNVDAKGAKMILDQLYSSADTALLLDGLNHLYVEKNNSFFSDGNYISGGKLQRTGLGSFRVVCNGGQFARLTVKNNASFTAKDCWWEGSSRIPLDIKGDGLITIDGGMIAPVSADSTPTIQIGRFEGKITLMNMYIQGGWKISPNNEKLELLCWNIHFYHQMNPSAVLNAGGSYRTMFAGLSSQCFESNNPACKSIMTFEPVNVNITNEEKFLEAMTSAARKSIPLNPSDKSVVSGNFIYLSRVCIGSANAAVKVKNDGQPRKG